METVPCKMRSILSLELVYVKSFYCFIFSFLLNAITFAHADQFQSFVDGQLTILLYRLRTFKYFP